MPLRWSGFPGGNSDLGRLLPLLLPPGRAERDPEQLSILQRASWVKPACERRLGAAFYVFLRGDGLWSSLPTDTQQLLEEAYRSNLTRYLVRENVLAEILRLLKPLGQLPILLKGIAFASELYPEPAARDVGDLDLMVPRELKPEVDRRLQEAGFQLLTHGDSAPPQAKSFLRRLAGRPSAAAEPRDAEGETVFLIQRAGCDVLIEIHYHLINLRPGGGKEEVFRSRSEVPPPTRPLQLPEGEVLVLEPAAAFLHALRHLALHHRFIGLRWHHDLALMLIHWETQLQPGQVFAQCRALNSEKILRVELALLREMFGPGILSDTASRAWQCGTLPWEYPLYRHLARGGKRSPWRELVRTLVAPGLRRQLRTLS
jgi:hypothetical protein